MVDKDEITIDTITTHFGYPETEAEQYLCQLTEFGYRSFSYHQECDVKRYMNSQPDKEEAAGTVLNASLPFLKSDECERVKGQLSYIVQDMKEELQQSQSRGYHM